MKDIYYAYPQAASAKDNDQHTPLYIAVEFGFEDAVEFLVNTCPEDVVNNGSYLRSAVHSLMCTNIIDSFITANPETAFVVDSNGDSAFDLFFRIWNIPMIIVIETSEISNHILDDEIGQGNWKIRDVYEKAFLFLWAINSREDTAACDDAPLLHSMIREESCHWAFCQFLIKLHPEQVLQRDAKGNLPIHIIAAARNRSDKESFLCIDCFTAKDRLIYAEFANGDTDYCCEDCFERKPTTFLTKVVCISPGM